MLQIQQLLTDKEYLDFRYDFSCVLDCVDWLYDTYYRNILLGGTPGVDLLLNYNNQLVCNVRYYNKELAVWFYVEDLSISEKSYNELIKSYLKVKQVVDKFKSNEIDIMQIYYVYYDNTINLGIEYGVAINHLCLRLGVNILSNIKNLYVSSVYDDVSLSGIRYGVDYSGYGTIHWQDKWWVHIVESSSTATFKNMHRAELSNEWDNYAVNYVELLNIDIMSNYSITDLLRDIKNVLKAKETVVSLKSINTNEKFLNDFYELVKRLYAVSGSVTFEIRSLKYMGEYYIEYDSYEQFMKNFEVDILGDLQKVSYDV